jgi:hypothetical protein
MSSVAFEKWYSGRFFSFQAFLVAQAYYLPERNELD